MSFKIKEVRLQKGLTQQQLAHKSGISRGTIHALENNPKYSTKTKTLSKIASALDSTVEEIFFDDCV